MVAKKLFPLIQHLDISLASKILQMQLVLNKVESLQVQLVLSKVKSLQVQLVLSKVKHRKAFFFNFTSTSI